MIDTGGKWWRFDDYKIERGVIHPGRGAHGTWYYPMVEHRRLTAKTGSGQAVYKDLFKLVRRLEVHYDREFTRGGKNLLEDKLPERLVKDITNWCRKYGLLGVLLFEATEMWVDKKAGKKESGLPVEYNVYSFNGGEWKSRVHTDFNLASFVLGERESLAKVSRARLVPSLTGNHASQVVEWHWERTEEHIPYLWKYFGDMGYTVTEEKVGRSRIIAGGLEPEAYLCHPPMTEAFWRDYTEPVTEFLRLGQTLLAAYRLLKGKPPIVPTGLRFFREQLPTGEDTLPEDSLTLRVRKQPPDSSLLNELLGGISPRVRLDNSTAGAFKLELSASSMVQILSMMMALDLDPRWLSDPFTHKGKDARPHVCACCGEMFLSIRKKKYCSRTCSNRLSKKNSRARAEIQGQAG